MPYGGAKVTINSEKRSLRPIFLSFIEFGAGTVRRRLRHGMAESRIAGGFVEVARRNRSRDVSVVRKGPRPHAADPPPASTADAMRSRGKTRGGFAVFIYNIYLSLSDDFAGKDRFFSAKSSNFVRIMRRCVCA